MALLTTLGLRHEEIDGLKLKYIKNNMIGVFEVLNQHNDLTPPKTESSKRWVPLTPLVEQYLKLAITNSRAIYAKQNIIMSPDSFIFINSLARPLRYSHLTNVFQLISKETGIHVWPHKMRHAFSTIAFGIAGLNPRDIANILGHSQIDMSLYYNNGTDEGKTSAMAKISQAF
jgi:integrase